MRLQHPARSPAHPRARVTRTYFRRKLPQLVALLRLLMSVDEEEVDLRFRFRLTDALDVTFVVSDDGSSAVSHSFRPDLLPFRRSAALDVSVSAAVRFGHRRLNATAAASSDAAASVFAAAAADADAGVVVCAADARFVGARELQHQLTAAAEHFRTDRIGSG